MNKHEFLLQLNSPAFLGDADQKGTWRTPPLKALLREWWRVAVAADIGYSVPQLKAREMALFGTAADEGGGDNHRSRILLALAHWEAGGLVDWSEVNPGVGGKPGVDPKVKHPEVDFDRGMVGSQLYLGFGPLKGSPVPRLQAGETNALKLAYATDWGGKTATYPEDVDEHMARTLTLAHWFGTIGGRSRNGWGSLAFCPAPAGLRAGGEGARGGMRLPVLTRASLEQSGCIRPLSRCLELDWPHAIGQDKSGPLVWQSAESFENWRDAMKFLARVKIGFRSHLGFSRGEPHPMPEDRHVLAYPVTRHKVLAWEGQNKGRLANTLRFKLHAIEGGGLRALVFHTPCKPTLTHGGIDLVNTWFRVHRWLDDPGVRAEAFRDLKLSRLS